MKRSVLRSWWSSSSCWPALCHAPPRRPAGCALHTSPGRSGPLQCRFCLTDGFPLTWTSCAPYAAMGLDLASRRDACFGRSPQRNLNWGTRQCSRRGCCCSCEQADACPACFVPSHAAHPLPYRNSKRVPAPVGQLLEWRPVAPDSSIARCCGSRGEKEPD